MKIVTLAAGVAVGYVLGTRAGREKYEQIAANARKLSTHPSVVQAQQKAKTLLETGTHKLAEKAGTTNAGSTAAGPSAAQYDGPTPAAIATPRPPRRKPTVNAEPLA